MTNLPVHALRFTLLAAVTLIVASFAISDGLFARDKAGRPAVGDEAADFELKTLQDDKLKLSKLVADGPVVLVVLRGFPGYQCPVCNSQVGQFLSKAKQFDAAKARIVLVYPGPADGLKKHADEFVRGKTWPDNFYLVLDPDYEFTKSYHLRWEAKNETAYPSTFVIDRERKIQFARISTTHGGRASADEVLKSLNRK
jgi:peroxiredoxin Q/BCP